MQLSLTGCLRSTSWTLRSGARCIKYITITNVVVTIPEFYTLSMRQLSALSLRYFLVYDIQDNVQQPVYNAFMYGKLELAQHIVRKYGADLNSIAQVYICIVYYA